MRGRVPYYWPAYVDLFSGFAFLLIGAVALFTPASGPGGGTAPTPTPTPSMTGKGPPKTPEEILAARLVDELIRLRGREGFECELVGSEDVKVTFYVEFAVGEDYFPDAEALALQEKVERYGRVIKSAVDVAWEATKNDVSPPMSKRKVQIVVEGHTDAQPFAGRTEAERSKKNWDLSAKRASTVLTLWEGPSVGLSAPEYNVVAWGRSYLVPRCSDPNPTADCYRRNRRTEIWLRYDDRGPGERGRTSRADSSGVPTRERP